MITYEYKTWALRPFLLYWGPFFHSVPKYAKISRFSQICPKMRHFGLLCKHLPLDEVVWSQLPYRIFARCSTLSRNRYLFNGIFSKLMPHYFWMDQVQIFSLLSRHYNNNVCIVRKGGLLDSLGGGKGGLMGELDKGLMGATVKGVQWGSRGGGRVQRDSKSWSRHQRRLEPSFTMAICIILRTFLPVAAANGPGLYSLRGSFCNRVFVFYNTYYRFNCIT